MLPSIFTHCIPREEILSGELSLDLFAAKLRLVVEGSAPLVYQDPNIFFNNTFPTEGLKTLIIEVFGRLAGTSVGSPIIRLETSFGGGKTHDEIALWHIARNGRDIEGLNRFTNNINLIPDRPIQVAAIACQDLDPINGVYHAETGITTYTLWGEIAYQIGGIQGYQLLRGSDEQKVSPGTSVLERLMNGQPTLIILDEIARHLRAAQGTPVVDSTLSKQVVAFLFSLMDLAASCNHLVFVYSLASSSDTFGEETNELQEVIRVSARQERVLSPSTDMEIYNIVKQRIFSSVDARTAESVAKEYSLSYKASRINLPDGCKEVRYTQAIEASYPFHPELFDLLTKKIASIPNFQRTRGSLRLFARVARYLWRDTTAWIPLIHTHHIPVGIDEEITSDLTSRLERPLMRLPLGADIYNPDGKEAHAQLKDQEWIAASKPTFPTWMARTIFLHSLTQGVTAGIRRTELNLSLLTPGVEINFIDTVIEQLEKIAWYLDTDPVTTLARFKEEPSINKIIAEEKELVGRTEAKDDLRSRRDTIFADKFFKLVSSPEVAGDIDDVAEPVALCVIDFDDDMVSSSIDEAPSRIEQLFNNTGDSGRFRTFRNRLLFLLANKNELEKAIDIAREYRAINTILKSPNRLDDLSENQKKQLKDKGGTKDLDVRIALTNAYRHLFYPANDAVKAPKGLMHYTLSPQDSSDIKGKNNQQEIILKALKDCQKIREQDANPYAPAFILHKVWPAGLEYLSTKALKETFAKNIGLNILLDAQISKLRDTIRQGLQTGKWDLKVGERIYIKSKETTLTLPDTIEFSEKMVLYRPGILELPKPKEIELNAQVMYSNDSLKPVHLRWRANGALSVTLYQDGIEISGEFRPSDGYETQLEKTATFQVVADYGNGEIVEKTTTAVIMDYRSQGSSATSKVSEKTAQLDFDLEDLVRVHIYYPDYLEEEGTINAVFTKLVDSFSDYKAQGISKLELSVSQIIDYRRLTTVLTYLSKFSVEIDQRSTIQVGKQFVRLEYQGDVKGFNSFLNPIKALLDNTEVRGDVMLKLVFDFPTPVQGTSQEIMDIQQALNRNPVERLNLSATMVY